MIVFGCTMGMAWLLTSSRSTPSYEEYSRAPMNWPIAFKLPTGYTWLPGEDFQSRNTAVNGDFGSLMFYGRGGESDAVVYDNTVRDSLNGIVLSGGNLDCSSMA